MFVTLKDLFFYLWKNKSIYEYILLYLLILIFEEPQNML